MRILKRLLLLSSLILLCTIGFSQDNKNGQPGHGTGFFGENMNYQLRAYFSIGGSTPIGFPETIRKIDFFNPALQLALEANATKWLTDRQKWGIRLGVAVEGKGMKAGAQVMNYKTEIIQDDAKVGGYFYGRVVTHVKNTYLTIPVSLVYNISGKWNLYAGPYISTAIDRGFDGYVEDGYFREGTPTSPKAEFDGDGRAPFDFSKDQSTTQWGVNIGSEYNLRPHFNLFGHVNYGISDVFPKDFTAITFGMHNFYMNIGFAYQF